MDYQRSDAVTLSRPSINWSGIVAGALIATGISAVLVAFGSALGLSIASTSPSWRDSSFALWILSGIFLLFTAALSFGVGGYVAGRMRPTVGVDSPYESDFSDGAHGLAVWSLSLLLGALIAVSAARTTPNVTASSPSATSSGEALLAPELDRLFRSDRRDAAPDREAARSEAARILLTASARDGVSAEDRTYLARMVSSRTEVVTADAERRVAAAVEASRQAISRARRTAVLTAFMVATALLLGAAMAWLGAREGALDHVARPGSLFARIFRTHADAENPFGMGRK